MDFSLVPIAKENFANLIYIGLGVSKKAMVALFSTKGNTMVKESLANDLNIEYIDTDYIEGKFKRAKLDRLLIGGLVLENVPILVGRDELFNLGKDASGNTFPADFILGWNIISRYSWRGSLREGKLEVQTSDFVKNKSPKANQPIINVEIGGEIFKVILDSSRPLSTISTRVEKKLIASNEEVKNTMDLLEDDQISYMGRLNFKIDNKSVSLSNCQVDKNIDQKDFDLIFGADLLRQTRWAIFGPMNFVRLENY